MQHSPSSISYIRKTFKDLHESGCFVIPNPWDVGSAKYLQGLGFKALATTSSGAAWALGRADNNLSREMVLSHLLDIVGATDLPVNADFEGGFADDPQGVFESVSRAVATGIAGLSIEDSTGNAERPLRPVDDGVARLKAARAAIDEAGGETLLVGRAENFIVGRPDLADTIARLKAYSAAGADVLYAPGISSEHEISAIVAAVAPKPLNLLVGSATERTVADIAALGVRRVSVGGALARVAWGGFMRAARGIAQHGSFDGLANSAAGSELNSFFRLSSDAPSSRRTVEIIGSVEYREGEGILMTIPRGIVEITITSADTTFSWVEGTFRGEASVPFANFCRYISDGAIRLDR